MSAPPRGREESDVDQPRLFRPHPSDDVPRTEPPRGMRVLCILRVLEAPALLVLTLHLAGCMMLRVHHEIDASMVLVIRREQVSVENALRDGTQVAMRGESRGLRVSDPVRARRDRFEEIRGLMLHGAVGEGEAGFLVPRESLDTATTALVEAENADRRRLYVDLAATAGLPSDRAEVVEAVGEVYAVGLLEGLEPGAWFQVPSRPSRLKEFRAGELGGSIPDAVPGEWRQVP